MGHAVYSISDPRAVMLKSFVEKLAQEKDRADEYQLYASVERLAREVIAKERKIYKGVSANVDFYSGFAYSMLGLPSQNCIHLFLLLPELRAGVLIELKNLFTQARLSGRRIKALRSGQPIHRSASGNFTDRGLFSIERL